MYDIDTLKRLRLGKVGESGYYNIEIDCRKWLDEFPNAILAIFAQRNGEIEMYAPACETGDGVIVWNVTDTDVAKSGMGHFEVRCYDLDDNRLRKSRTIITIVDPSMEGDEDLTAPDAFKRWQDRLIISEGTALQAAATALKAAQDVIDQANETLNAEKLRVEEDPERPGYIKLTGGYDFTNVRMPVGSYYISEGSIDPSNIYGGEWEKLSGVTLMASSASRPILTTGGAESAMLTMDQIPEGVQRK